MDSSTTLRFCILMILASTLIYSVSAQTSEVTVRIINSQPKVLGLYANPIVKPSQTEIIWCASTLEDLNSFKDLTSQKAFIVASSGVKKYPDLSYSEQTAISRGFFLTGFVLDSTAPEGVWSCEVECSDTAGDRASNQTPFTVFQASCGNGVQDAGEEKTDCGGGCMPCACKNGVKDDEEAGVDCGGQCKYCTDKGDLKLTVPSAVNVGETIPVDVKAGKNGIVSLVRVTKPSGKYLIFRTDDSTHLAIPSDEAGTWLVQADLYGYVPAEAKVNVRTPTTTYVVGAVVVIVLLAIIYLLYKRFRKKQLPNSP
ncbi:MAG: hypothetical protein V1744_04770 [Candidatus Altiarchaeota archaeon]